MSNNVNDVVKEAIQAIPEGVVETKIDRAVFIGNTLDQLHAMELSEAKFRNLYAPNKPEYYTIDTRPIVGVDDLLELVMTFTVDMPVTVQYGDMMLNDVKKISIMPNINNEGGYITIEDSNELQLALLIPESDMYSLYVKEVSVEDDMMLFIGVDIIYYETPNMEYPHIWVERVYEGDIESYTIKAKLNPFMINPIILMECERTDPIILNIMMIAAKLRENNELAFIPYSSILVDDNYECYRKLQAGDIYLDIESTDAINDENIAIPYIDFMNLEKEYQFKYYISSSALVIKVNDNGSIDMQIINGEFEDEERNLEVLGSLYHHYAAIISDLSDSMINTKAIDGFLEDADIDGCVIVDSPNDQILLLKAGSDHQVKLV